jgi:hypothetical protein
MPENCPASLRPTAARLWKSFRSKPNAVPVGDKNCSPSHRNRVHLQSGMLFGITPEWCSASDRNRVHLRPDSPLKIVEVFQEEQPGRLLGVIELGSAPGFFPKNVVDISESLFEHMNIVNAF